MAGWLVVAAGCLAKALLPADSGLTSNSRKAATPPQWAYPTDTLQSVTEEVGLCLPPPTCLEVGGACAREREREGDG